MTDPPDPAGTSEADPADEEPEDGRIGPFPSWRALYIAVLLYTAGLVVVLWVLTRALDHTLP